MKKRITAFLLSVVLCLSLVGTAFAAENSTPKAEFTKAEIGDSAVTVEITGLKPNKLYYGCTLSVTPKGESSYAITPFSFYATEEGTYVYESPDGEVPVLKVGDALQINIPQADIHERIEIKEPEVKEFTVTFNTMGGSAIAPVKVKAGEKVAEPVPPTRNGYKFQWWSTVESDPKGEAKYNFADLVEADITLYAQWIEVKDPGGDKPPVVITPQPSPAPGGSTSSRDDRDDDDDDDRPVTVKKTSHGSVSYSPSTPKKGDTVTVTIRPDDGYELATLTVRRSGAGTIATTKVSDTEYTFVMPAGSVIIEATFRTKTVTPSAPSFPDVPVGYTFYADITWVASRGYMAGYGDGTFRPTANTTRQALWMVLGRMAGAAPADMNAARSWAMQNGVSDGTNGGSGMTRQQMVTMLYRYAQQRGYTVSGSANLASYPDGGSVAGYAQEAMAWAVANGIVQGTADGRLNPAGVATRAHFAAFLHRFCQTVGVA